MNISILFYLANLVHEHQQHHHIHHHITSYMSKSSNDSKYQ